MCDDDDLVGAEVAELILDRTDRIGITNLAFGDEPLLNSPGERRLEPHLRLLALAIDIPRPVMRS
jgi:hypothetical protein